MRLLALPVATLLALTGCPSDPADGTDTLDVAIPFAARVASQDAACGTNYEGVGATGETVALQDFRFFVSNLKLVQADGAQVPVELDQDSDWQHEGLALLDFEDGTGPCAETGTAELNDTVVGTVPDGEYEALVFDLGVPFELNHVDSATAPAPLNLIALQWNWQGGYKFARVDMTNSNAAPDNRWFFHLGSTGCESEAASIAPTTECAKPNRPTYELAQFDVASDTVVFDLGDLLEGVDVSVNTADTPPGCMSFPADVDDCAVLFPNLGLDWGTGACADGCAGQTPFALE